METNRADVILEAKLRDGVRLSEHDGKPRFVGFLDERQANLAQKIMTNLCYKNYMLWGGYDEAERVVFGVYPEFLTPDTAQFPITPITAAYRRSDTPTHRDFLGSLLGKGIQRETLGDILVGEGRCVLFVRSEIADFVISQTEKVGRIGVALTAGAEEPLPAAHRFEDLSVIVASNRLDCIVAAFTGISREKSADLIRSGLVMLNHEISTDVSVSVAQGNKLSIRGKGRFLLDRLGPMTQKGRLCVAGKKYI
ncbi:MAG TPA: YlmH/Sll1252 family protein [Caproiciproducens sp.]|nr:YlmH/Sll1252 family protein [Caproiciproducens sp.]